MPLSQKAANSKDINTGKADMQHRHFATIATIIRSFPVDEERAHIAAHFADELSDTNPKFDRKRFLAACVTESK